MVRFNKPISEQKHLRLTRGHPIAVAQFENPDLSLVLSLCSHLQTDHFDFNPDNTDDHLDEMEDGFFPEDSMEWGKIYVTT